MAAVNAGPAPFSISRGAKAGFALLLAYFVWAAAQLEFTGERFIVGLGNAARFFDRMFPPSVHDWDGLLRGLTESLQIAVLAALALLTVGGW